MKSIQIQIKDDYITLGQLLKLADIVSSGGEVKVYLSEHTLEVNGEQETRRGRKLYPGDLILIDQQQQIKVVKGS